MNIDLSGKTALVTGSTQGIGLAIARGLAQAGARVVVNGRSQSRVDEDTIKTYVKDNLARDKVPREVIFLDELPRNPTGKILKRELREIDVE